MIYKGNKTREISFPLGGIGAGCIGLAGNGQLIDWEVLNLPAKNTLNGYSHFAIKVKTAEGCDTRVLHADTTENYTGAYMHETGRHCGFGYGVHGNSLAGFPHFKSADFEGNFPIANMTFREEGFPVCARLTAWNPFIPHNEYDSSLPAAFFEWEIENLTEGDAEIALALTAKNMADGSTINRKVQTENGCGLFLCEAEKNKDQIGYSDICLLTDAEDAMAVEYWYRGRWRDGCTTYWRDLTLKDRLPERHYEEAGKGDHGVVAAYVKLAAGERRKVRFIIAWYAPVQYNYWSPIKNEAGEDITWKNYYATQFESSEAVAAYAMKNYDRLYSSTKMFADAIQQSSLSAAAKDAISANLSVLKSPTVLRLEDGSLWGWEGVSSTFGSCEGTCQHVWNYAYALPFLFPKLERSLRDNNLKYALKESGETSFRIPLPLGRVRNFRACVDGQMGEVIKCYREWIISGDTEWLRQNAEGIYRMLEYAWSDKNPDRWDINMDGVMEGRQHHTLDMELYGPSAWLQGFYLLALDCGAKIAEALKEPTRAAKYREIYEKGKAWTNENLFNGSYFAHKVELTDKGVIDSFGADEYWNYEANEIKYQIADGCIIDQMLADWHAVLIGCDGVFDKDKKHKALESLYKHNFIPCMREIANMWRLYSVNDEAGTIICSYPEGAERPVIPIPYCDETMTGFEYSLAGLMIAEGFTAEGERMVEAIRDRFNGEKRNPWNEFECGNNYARSMASYALMPIYSGFSYDMSRGYIGFAPLQGSGKFLWSVKDSWGTVELDGESCTLTVLGEPLTLSSLGLVFADKAVKAVADGAQIGFDTENGELRFEGELTLKKALKISTR